MAIGGMDDGRDWLGEPTLDDLRADWIDQGFCAPRDLVVMRRNPTSACHAKATVSVPERAPSSHASAGS